MAAEITFDQPTGAGAGTAGKARNDIWLDQVVNMVSSGTGTVYLWELLDAPFGSSAVILNAALSTANITPDVVGTYRISLTVDGADNVIKVFRARYDSTGVLANRGWALPAVDEEADEADYGTNVRHWAEPWESLIADILANAAIELGGDLGPWTPASPALQRVIGVDTIPSPISDTAVAGRFLKIAPTFTWVSPRAVVLDGDLLWIGYHDQNDNPYTSVYCLNLSTGLIVATVDVSTGFFTGETGVRDLAQDDDYVYAACWKTGGIAIISKATNAVVGWGSIGTLNSTPRQITSVAADNAGNFYALGRHSANGWGIFKWSTAACIGAAYDTVEPTLEVYDNTKFIYDNARKIRHWSGYLWVAGGSSSPMLRKNDPATLAVVIDSADVGQGMNVAFYGSNVYVSDNDANRIIKYDTDCAFVDDVTTAPLGEITQPDAMAFDDQGSGYFMVTGVQNTYCALVNSSTMTASFFPLPSDRWGEMVSYNGEFLLAGFGVAGGGVG